MASKFRDYDAAWAERTDEPIPFGRIYGEDVTLPAKLPAKLALDVVALRDEHGDDAEVPPGIVLDIVHQLFTEERVRRWLSAGMDFDQLGELMGDAMDAYFNPEGDGGGDSPPAKPARGRSTSSKAGRSSKPTSPANTKAKKAAT